MAQIEQRLTYEKKLILDDLIAEIMEKFYTYRPTLLRYCIYERLRQCNSAEYDYLVAKISEHRVLYETVFDVILEFTYHKPSVEGMEDKISKTKVVVDDNGKYKTLKLWGDLF